MKRQEAIALLLVGTMLSGIAAVAAEAGSAADPLIALNWLKDTFIPNAAEQADDHADERLDQFLSTEANGTELRVKRADVIWLESGSTLTPLAGELNAAAAKGTVVDTTVGEELPANGSAAVAANHRYLAAENTQAAFSVTSDTAVIRLTGAYQISPSENTDYNALAGALKAMGLFQGSDVPYGNNYELETAPTRIQGLVMFLRLMGEEQYALAYPGSGITFADVPDWAEPYVAYAYDRGYTKGQEIDSQWRVVFGTQDPLAPRDYMTFLLRALGYSEGSDFQWLSAVTDAQTLGVLTAGEVFELTEKPFLRAQVVYLSYFALPAKTADGETLLERLSAAGIVDATIVDNIMLNMEGQRL